MNIVISALLLIFGFMLLVKGADWFVGGASSIASRFQVPSLVIGLTVVAMGTSLPEAAISISASLKGSAGIAIGNVIGSNIMNIALILGITAIITPLAVQNTTRKYEIPFVVIITILLTVLGLNQGIVSQFDGIILLVAFVAYLAYTFKVAKSGDSQVEEDDQADISSNIIKILAVTLLGAICIAVGGDLTVDGASGLAREFGISEDVIGLTIVAFGTSLPELVTCIVAALKKETDIAIGNIVGSNIFNVLFVIGAASFINPIPFYSEFFKDSLVCIGMPIILWLLVCNKDRKLKNWGGVVLLLAYAAYFITCNMGII